MCQWIRDPVERQAVMANAATKCLQEDYPVIIEIACANSSAELLQVKTAYHDLYQRSLEEDVAANSAGNLRGVCHIILPGPSPQPYYTILIRSFLSFSTYICILIPSVRCLLQLLLALVSTYRYDGDAVDSRLAKSEAKIVHETIRNGTTDHQYLIRIVGTRSKAQLHATFSCFRDEQGTSITKVI
jgi:annexin D